MLVFLLHTRSHAFRNFLFVSLFYVSFRFTSPLKNAFYKETYSPMHRNMEPGLPPLRFSECTYVRKLICNLPRAVRWSKIWWGNVHTSARNLMMCVSNSHCASYYESRPAPSNGTYIGWIMIMSHVYKVLVSDSESAFDHLRFSSYCTDLSRSLFYVKRFSLHFIWSIEYLPNYFIQSSKKPCK